MKIKMLILVAILLVPFAVGQAWASMADYDYPGNGKALGLLKQASWGEKSQHFNGHGADDLFYLADVSLGFDSNHPGVPGVTGTNFATPLPPTALLVGGGLLGLVLLGRRRRELTQ